MAAAGNGAGQLTVAVWKVRKSGREWQVFKRGQWHLTTTHWWLAMWVATGDRRHVPAGEWDLARLARS